MTSYITVDNINWRFRYGELNGLGNSQVGIPKNMLRRFLNECGYEDRLGDTVLPHYDWSGETFDLKEDHECYNTDTQIVLMNWLGGKRRKYNLDYVGDDPFWIFHDNRHSKKDVYSSMVSNIDSYTEFQRLLEGAEMAMDHDYTIKAETLVSIGEHWDHRFQMEGSRKTRFNAAEFFNLMPQHEVDHYQQIEQFY